MYQENRLVEPGGITLSGVPIDLRKIATPTFILATKEDHIAPWKSTYAATQLYRGPTRFVLAASGHIAGVVNPPAAEKYHHWTSAKLPDDPAAWRAAARQQPGWGGREGGGGVGKSGGGRVPARQPGDGKLMPIGDAPGSSVAARLQ